jgi:NADPH:quinone reductase-like Zn-dependent oxidoreductase
MLRHSDTSRFASILDSLVLSLSMPTDRSTGSRYDTGYDAGSRLSYRIHRTGALSNLVLESESPRRADTGADALAPHEVLVRVSAIGLNFADIFAIFGLYSATPKEPFVPGLEYAGTIAATGSAVHQLSPLRVGDRVMGAIRFGAYTTHVVVDVRYVLPLPDDWTMPEGAAFIVQALTAYYALKHLGGLDDVLRRYAASINSTNSPTRAAPPAPAVLIHSAAGGVGLYANRIAKALASAATSRVRTIGTIGSASKRDLLLREGYDSIIVRPTSAFGRNSRAAARDFKRLLGDALVDNVDNVDAADDSGNARAIHNPTKAASPLVPSPLVPSPLVLSLDSLGGRIMQAGYDALAPAGRMVCFGSAHLAFQGNRPNYLTLGWTYLQRPRYDPLTMIEENKAVLGFNLIYLWENLPLMNEMLAELAVMRLPKPLVGHTFPFDKLPEALRTFQSGTTTGKVVVLVE